MDVQLLEDIGLTKAQATAYEALVRLGKSTAPEIAKATDESRSNTYKLLDKLCELGLATKDESETKVHYFPASPAALEQFIQKQTEEAHLRERKLSAALPGMLDFFFQHSEQPSIRYFQGKESIKQIHTDLLATGQTLYLLRSPYDTKFYDIPFFEELRRKRVMMGIKTVAIVPFIKDANHDPEVDKKYGVSRTWLPTDAYTAQAEWSVAGGKVALISYSEEAMGMIIESEHIAESFRQVFRLLSKQQSPTLQPEQQEIASAD